MIDAKTVRGLTERYIKADELVKAGAVFPVSGLAGYYCVRNGDGTQVYLVRIEAGHEHCSCPDFVDRQGPAGLPCKHILAAELAATRAATPAYGDAPAEPLPAIADPALHRNPAVAEAAGRRRARDRQGNELAPVSGREALAILNDEAA